jgi:hypothetical protein
VFLNVSNALYYVYNLYACRTLQQVSYIPQQGYHGGTSRTFVCGKVDDSINHFLKVSYPWCVTWSSRIQISTLPISIYAISGEAWTILERGGRRVSHLPKGGGGVGLVYFCQSSAETRASFIHNKASPLYAMLPDLCIVVHLFCTNLYYIIVQKSHETEWARGVSTWVKPFTSEHEQMIISSFASSGSWRMLGERHFCLQGWS